MESSPIQVLPFGSRPSFNRDLVLESGAALATTSTNTIMQKVDTVAEIDVTDAQVHFCSAIAAAPLVTTPVFGISIQQSSSPLGNGHVRRKAGPVPRFP